MFDIGAQELLVIAVVAVLVIGPKDMPLALRTAGRWMGKMRRISGHFRAGIDTMIREAEMEEMEKKWREQNERIMREHPAGMPPGAGGEPVDILPPPATAEASAEEPAKPGAEGKPALPTDTTPPVG